ncbi:MAG: hypothetical protein K8T25_10595 [Planctomycetia bacterium]|nr:hypothetical protein [Planctomycetia bacterium]
MLKEMSDPNSELRYRFQCDLCSGPDWFGENLDAPAACTKCGRSPVRYFVADAAYCFLHRTLMRDTYTTSSGFLFAVFTWWGNEHLFPNAKLYMVPVDSDDPKDCITFQFCAMCEQAKQQWLKTV